MAEAQGGGCRACTALTVHAPQLPQLACWQPLAALDGTAGVRHDVRGPRANPDVAVAGATSPSRSSWRPPRCARAPRQTATACQWSPPRLPGTWPAPPDARGEGRLFAVCLTRMPPPAARASRCSPWDEEKRPPPHTPRQKKGNQLTNQIAHLLRVALGQRHTRHLLHVHPQCAADKTKRSSYPPSRPSNHPTNQMNHPPAARASPLFTLGRREKNPTRPPQKAAN